MHTTLTHCRTNQEQTDSAMFRKLTIQDVNWEARYQL